ncbi:MAG: hypothetical protein ABIR16_06525 [Dokdonella sp.]
MNIRNFFFASIAALGLAACQREEAPAAPAAPATPTTAVVEAPAVPAVAESAAGAATEQAAMDFGHRCRLSDGAWNGVAENCDVTAVLCPTFGTWVDGVGCKTESAEADCKADGEQFVADQGCLIRYIPASAMRDEDFKKD